MLATLVLAPLLMAQAVTEDMVEQQYETGEVAYEELMAGEYEAAIVVLEAALEEHPGDPAILINLGSAYAALGEYINAEVHFRAARESDERYDLELANGRWLDSREAATLALATVELQELAAR